MVSIREDSDNKADYNSDKKIPKDEMKHGRKQKVNLT